MTIDRAVHSFAQWRRQAREALAAGQKPEDLYWREAQVDLLPGLFESPGPDATRLPDKSTSVPEAFLSLAQKVACYRDPERWAFLYKILWRLTHGEPHLLDIVSDDDVLRLHHMAAQVRKDIHKMHAFVRFEAVEHEGQTHYIAWHRPDHYIVEEAAPFFVRRFAGMRWTIMTVDQTATWDGEDLLFTPGVERPATMGRDPIESLWRRYYVSIFNPARLKIKMMKKEMAVRYWPTMPETTAIPELIRQASSRVERMSQPVPSAAAFIPQTDDLSAVREASKGCRGCDLCELGSQTVFGEGPKKASIVMIGEQPGDEEDRTGHPFVGPAGRLLNRALEKAGLNREEIYITNAVKHFRFELKGKFRLHKKPSARHLQACKPWLKKELELIQPKTIVCLGATAAQTVMGRAVTIKDVRGQKLEHAIADRLLVTVHPSSLLRLPDPSMMDAEFDRFVEDLRLAK